MATAKDPELLLGDACPAGSARSHPWMLFEDLDQDGYYDHVTVGLCNGSTAGRDFDVMPSDPWSLAPGTSAVGQLPVIAGVADGIAFTEKHLASSGLWSWAVIESCQGTPVCSYARSESGTLASTCPPGGS